jgi:hypothetical protein
VKLLTLLFCSFWLAVALVASAQSEGQLVTAQSFSRQFTAQELRHYSGRSFAPHAVQVPMAGGWGFLLPAAPASVGAPDDKINLEPALIVVSCERLKESLLFELGMKDEWQGAVALLIDSSWKDDREPSLTAIHHPSGWSYELALPKAIKPEILVRALVETLLVEMANRRAGEQSAEIPYWLAEGMSAHLQAYNLPMFVIRPNTQGANGRVTIDGADGVRLQLRTHTPVSFQQLCWPAPEDLAGANGALYRSCAQLFVENLLDMKDGRACLRRMLNEMPAHLNWQTAFLMGFHSHFEQLLDVEKWWGLSCVSFEGGDATPWTGEQCWRKLQDALDVPVEVHLDPSRLPTEARLTLQEVITQWDATNVQHALQRTVQDLQLLHWRGGREVRPLVDQYLTVLSGYLHQNQAALQLEAVKRNPPHRFKVVQKETVRNLDILDKKRVALRARFVPSYRVSQVSTGETVRQ